MKFRLIDWGAADANWENRAEFVTTFVDLPEMNLLLDPKYCVITGEKGSGKTALRIKIESLAQEGRFGPTHVASIDFKTGDFETFENMLGKLSDHTHIAPQRLLRNYWQFLIIVECVKAVSRVDDEFRKNVVEAGDFSEHTRTFLRQPETSGLSTTTLGDYMRGLIHSAWTIFELKQDDSGHAEAVRDVLHFPLALSDYLRLWEQLRYYLTDSGKMACVLLDGFDVFYDTANQSEIEAMEVDTSSGKHIRYVFDSLLDAVLFLTTSPTFQHLLLVKVLIPHDRIVVSGLRDLDKLRSRQLRIRWEPEKLREFLRVRINKSLGTNYREFSTAWKNAMPSEITNRTYGFDEASFNYLLRHTMWRPRHLQSHLNQFQQKYQQTTSGTRVEVLVEMAVRESCERLVADFIREYKIDHPEFGHFLSRFRGRPNIMLFAEFTKLIKASIRDLQEERRWTVPEKLRLLFKMGFFGVVEAISQVHYRGDPYALKRRSGVAPYRCNFFYKIMEPHPGFPQIHDSDEIAIHPIFFDYCQMKADPKRIVG